MGHENELTREKTEERQRRQQQRRPSEIEDDTPSTVSDSSSDEHPSINDVILVNFQPGEPADPHNWSKVST